MTTIKTPHTPFSLKSLLSTQDAVMAVLVVLIIGMMLIPFPPIILDMLIALNLAISLGILLSSMYITRAVEFYSFPTVLLMITMLRLGVNISSTRLILLNGSAGKMIAMFGEMIVGGNYVVGVIIFLILMVIQWVVINNGAGRVAEVAARFTLDALPGKQLSIDADLNAGLLDETQARLRRKEVQSEADFYGAMDGASKFVKGDAIAAVIVMVVNILGGFVIGIVQYNMTFLDALQNYTLLTVGAGLAVQIPALLVSASAGLLVTRSTSEVSLGSDLAKQFSNESVLWVTALIMGTMLLVPGLPKMPFILISGVLGVVASRVSRAKSAPVIEEEVQIAPTQPESPEDMLQMVVTDPLEIEVGYGLVNLIDENLEDNLLRRIIEIRRQMMAELGLVVPVVRVRDNMQLQPQVYRIKIRGEEVAQGELLLDKMLAIPGAEADDDLVGTPTTEPAFGLPAKWINSNDKGRAELSGHTVVNPISVLSTHLTEIVRGNAAELVTRQLVSEMLDRLKSKAPAAVEGLIPEMLGLGELQAVLQIMLGERVPIRDLGGVLEILATMVSTTRDPYILAEAVRQSMARTLSNQYKDENNFLHVFTLAPDLEELLKGSLATSERGGVNLQVDAELTQLIVLKTGEQMEQMAQKGYFPVLLCPRDLRLAFRRFVESSLPNLVVLAFSEVSQGIKVQSYGMVQLT